MESTGQAATEQKCAPQLGNLADNVVIPIIKPRRKGQCIIGISAGIGSVTYGDQAVLARRCTKDSGQ